LQPKRGQRHFINELRIYMKTVCIEMADDSTFMVGMEPEGADAGMTEGSAGEMERDKSYMQPVASIDEALAMAKELLSGNAGSDMSPEKMFEQPKQPADAMQAGFQKARGMPAGM
jgi:hypothetical protein